MSGIWDENRNRDVAVGLIFPIEVGGRRFFCGLLDNRRPVLAAHPKAKLLNELFGFPLRWRANFDCWHLPPRRNELQT
jgi:hypothetical protein